MPIHVRPVRETDRPEWLRLRRLLWPDCPEEDHAAETAAYLRGPDLAVFVAEQDGGGLGGFVEAGLRREAEGCGPGPVGYVEGWYVDADLRRRGVGRRLVLAAEDWARGRGCTDMASDADVGNAVSRAAHAHLGYEEVNRLAHFRKPLRSGADGDSPAPGGEAPLEPGRTRPMAETVLWTFFYGSFINLDVLKQAGYVPGRVEVARLHGFDIRIRPLANLVRSERHSVYGILATATHEQLRRLYAQGWVGTYLPEPVLVETRDGTWRPALCYIAPSSEDRPASDDYIDRIVGPARGHGFPDWYVARLESFRPQ
jgi:aminoglycoside 6'-N-acetyltransferase I